MTETDADELVLGGKTYPLRLTFSAIMKAEDKTGHNFADLEVFDGDRKDDGRYAGMSVTDTIALAWAVASETDDKLTYEAVVSQMGEMSMSFFDVRRALIRRASKVLVPVDDKPDQDFGPGREGDGPEPASTLALVGAST